MTFISLLVSLQHSWQYKNHIIMKLDMWFSADSYKRRFTFVRISISRLDFSFIRWVLGQIKCTNFFRPGLCLGPCWDLRTHSRMGRGISITQQQCVLPYK